MKSVRAKPAAPSSRAQVVGFEEQRLPSDALVWHLCAPGELRRDTDPVWTATVHKTERAVLKSGEPVLYYLMTKRAGKRAFVREELQPVPSSIYSAGSGRLPLGASHPQRRLPGDKVVQHPPRRLPDTTPE